MSRRNWFAPFTLAAAAVFVVIVAAAGTRGAALAGEVSNWSAAPLAAATLPSGSLSFVAITPCRVADTRNPTGTYGGPQIGAHATRSFPIAGQCGVGATAVAVSFNFTVTSLTTDGDLRVFPTGGSVPLVSTQNWTPHTGAIANAATTPLGTGGAVTVQNDGFTAIDLIIDVNGYYAPALITGTFVVFATAAAANDRAYSAVSFPTALAQAPTGVHYVASGSLAPADCPGSVSSPQAAPGHLCVYESYNGFLANTQSRLIFDQIGLFGPAASRYGFALQLYANSPGIVYSAGSWAVTAP